MSWGGMTEDLPSISIVIPTLNSAGTLDLCLQSILKQDYPKHKVEVIVADGGSKDMTLEIAEKYRPDKILCNPLKSGEAGKAVGVGAAQNEIIALIDSDNILPTNDWLRRIVQPFKDILIAGSDPFCYTYRREDPLVTRYCALLGMNDPLCLYLGNYDRYCYITGRWTNRQVEAIDRGNYIKVKLDVMNIPTIGANGFLVRADLVRKAYDKPYFFDVDVVYNLAKNGQIWFAKCKVGIIHLYARNVGTFLGKTYRRVRDYLFYKRHGLRRYPWRINRLKLLQFALFTVLLFPLVRDSLRGYAKFPERAWLFHAIACWIVLLTYGTKLILNGSIKSNDLEIVVEQ